ncbi:hypothetical protein B0T11DRAFT_285278 [Plectosphaerella cucumerina]|uniref:Uncharacterized protein n=1 Tax=Plectosphaerella cucumerina TaxID=40658 RepID=A0A8K0X3J4_9PEZI|nr:hypothetical protein B0T11DRAFT_285278 [Plectosphaerella cucumerina]
MKTLRVLAAWAIYQLTACAQETSDLCDSVTVTQVSQDIPCVTVGSLVIDPDLAGTFELDGVRQVRSLQMNNNAGLKRLRSTTLERVVYDLYLNNSGSLTEISLPNLTHVQEFIVEDAPKLLTIDVGEAGVLGGDYFAIWGTAMVDLTLNPVAVGYFNIRNNPSLMSFSSSVRNISGWAHIEVNKWISVSFVSLPDLVWAGSLYISQSGSVGLGSLESVYSAFELVNNDFESLSLPVLKTVTGSLTITKNTEVVELDFPQLETVGESLTVSENPAIVELDGFPKLADVSTKVVLDGDFKYVELPSLSNAADGLWVTSSENISYSCAALEKVFQSERPHQAFECRGSGETGEQNQGGTNTGGQDGAQTVPTPSLSGGAIAGIVVGALAAVGILAAGLFIVRKRRRTGAAVEEATSAIDADDLRDPKFLGLHPDGSELQGNPRSELASPDPELEGSRVNDAGTVYYEVEDTGRVGRK